MYRYKKVNIGKGKTRDEHRLLMEQKIGRKLEFNEVVHHKDGNKFNNDIDNLEIMLRSEHSRLHMQGQSRMQSDEEKERFRKVSQEHLTTSENIEIVKTIRKLLAEKVKQNDIAVITGWSKFSVSRIKHGKSFEWIS